MAEQSILYEEKNAFCLITLNRPQALNAFSYDLVENLIYALQKAEQDEKIRVIILTGAGKSFSAGGDLNTLDQFETLAEKRAFIEKVGMIVKTIYHAKKPVLAMVNGVAAGAGFNLALACDFVFASEEARFIQSFVNVGLSPDCGGFYFLVKNIGLLRAKELMLTARPVDAKEAKNLGLVNEVYQKEKLRANVFDFAEKLTQKPPLALSFTKQALNNSLATLDDTLTLETLFSSSLLETEDFKEGVRAFLEKRSPVFKGK